jgi:hypothetical protein
MRPSSSVNRRQAGLTKFFLNKLWFIGGVLASMILTVRIRGQREQ